MSVSLRSSPSCAQAIIAGSRQRGESGMEWVGETDKYYNLNLEIYRLNKADLDLPEPACAPAPGSP